MARTRGSAPWPQGYGERKDQINETLGITPLTPSQKMKQDIEDTRSYQEGKPIVQPFQGYKGPGKPIGPENEQFMDPTKEYPGSWGRRTEAPSSQYVAQAAPAFSAASQAYHGQPTLGSPPIAMSPANPASLPRTPTGPMGTPPMMFPTVPQVNPVAPFNSPTAPGSSQQMQPGMGGAPTGINPQQLLMILGGLGGPQRNPMMPGGGMSPQPGPPTQAAANILGGLTGGIRG